MKDIMKIFLRRIMIYSAFLAFAGVILSLVLPAGTVTPALPALIVFFLAIAWAIIWYLFRASEKSFVKFVNAFLATTGLKLLTLILVIVGYIFLNRGDAVPFLVAFFILYLLYTGFEVYAVLYLSKHQKKG
jgi:F0F1-type ATP synthase assembly protein I